MKGIVQRFYNKLQRIALVREVANFFMTREATYQQHMRDVLDRYIRDSKRDERGNFVVREGLFAGLKYPTQSFVWSEFAPRIAGSYEMELHSCLDRWIKQERFSSFVDIGAAEGHYVAAIGRLVPGVPIFAFEEKTEAHDVIKKLAETNDISGKVELLGRFEPDSLSALPLGERPLVLVDIEGGELGLCERVCVDALRRAHLIVEAHDSNVPRVSGRLISAFRATHQIAKVQPSRSLRRRLQAARHMDRWQFDVIIDERRGRDIFWLIMEPK